jgi:hypothetical protein
MMFEKAEKRLRDDVLKGRGFKPRRSMPQKSARL